MLTPRSLAAVSSHATPTSTEKRKRFYQSPNTLSLAAVLSFTYSPSSTVMYLQKTESKLTVNANQTILTAEGTRAT